MCPAGEVSGADERLTDWVYRIRVRRLYAGIYDSLSDRQSLTFRCTLLNFLIKLSHGLPKTNQSPKHISLPFNHTTFLLEKTETIEPGDSRISFQPLVLPSPSKCAQYLRWLKQSSGLVIDILPLSMAIIPYLNNDKISHLPLFSCFPSLRPPSALHIFLCLHGRASDRH